MRDMNVCKSMLYTISADMEVLNSKCSHQREMQMGSKETFMKRENISFYYVPKNPKLFCHFDLFVPLLVIYCFSEITPLCPFSYATLFL